MKATNQYSCLLDSFAFVLETTAEQLMQEIGHDGSELVDEKFPRAFHPQEFMPSCLRRHLAIMPVYVEAELEYPNGFCRSIPCEWFDSIINERPAVIEGMGSRMAHACAWDGELIHDCRYADPYSLDAAPAFLFKPEIFWLIYKIR